MSNLTETDYKRMSIDQSFKPYQRENLKVVYKIELDNEKIIIIIIDVLSVKF